jgi:hypothetical protein
MELDWTPATMTNRGVDVPVWALDAEGKPTGSEEVRQIRFTSWELMRVEEEFREYTVKESVAERIMKQTIENDAEGVPQFRPRTSTTGRRITEERVYYGQEALSVASEHEPASTLARICSIVWDEPVKAAATRLIPAKQSVYLAAVNTALSISQGVDPTVAADLLRVGVEAAAEGLESMETAMKEAVEEMGSLRGESGSGSGSSRAAPAKRSSRKAPAKSSKPSKRSAT